MDKLIGDLQNVKMGSPLRGNYQNSPIDMYQKMEIQPDMPIKDVMEKDIRKTIADREQERMKKQLQIEKSHNKQKNLKRKFQ